MLQISQTLLFALTIFSLYVFPSQATVSDACGVATSLLLLDPSLESLQAQVLSSLSTDINSCTQGTCTVDANKYYSNYKTACTTAGGRIFVTDLSYTCSNEPVSILNDATCVGQNCTASESKEYLMSIYDEFLVRTNLITNAEYYCTFNGYVNVKTSGSNHCDAPFGLIMLFFSSLLGFLWYWVVVLFSSLCRFFFMPISVRHIHVRPTKSH